MHDPFQPGLNLTSLSVVEVNNKHLLRKYLQLPYQVHQNDKNFIPPLYSDERDLFDRTKNHALDYSEYKLFLVTADGKPAGRIMAIINHQYNKAHNELTGRFFQLECYNYFEIADLLLKSAAAWLREKGMNQMIGPFGFSDKDPQGIRIEGFEHPAVIATAINASYMESLIEKAGLKKLTDCVVYKIPVPENVPEKYTRIYDRINHKYRLLEFKTRRSLKPHIVPVLRMVNETYSSLLGFTPMSETEMKELAKKYLPVLDPEFTKLITDHKGNPVAFVVASPDISKGLIKAKGRIFPFGFIHILSALKTSKQLDLFLGAVKKEYQSKGLIAMLAVPLYRSAIRKKMEFMDSHLILEENFPMRKIMEGAGGMVYKRYRIYRAELTQ